MGYASKAGRAHTSVRRPVAQAVCDRCGMWYSHTALVWQYDYAGTGLINKRLLVCTRTCLDKPQAQLRALIIPADPVPIRNPRTEPFVEDES